MGVRFPHAGPKFKTQVLHKKDLTINQIGITILVLTVRKQSCFTLRFFKNLAGYDCWRYVQRTDGEGKQAKVQPAFEPQSSNTSVPNNHRIIRKSC